MLDIYSTKARVWPALLSGLPIPVMTYLLVPTLEWWHGLSWASATAVGLTLFLALLARRAGKMKEQFLYAMWGGKPTTRYLRHRDTPLDDLTHERYHRNISTLFPEIKMPSLRKETGNPGDADEIYEAATRLLISRTRDTRRFPLLYKELVHYGFCRNVWGLKRAALCFTVLGILACSWALVVQVRSGGARLPVMIAADLALVVWMVVWIVLVTPDWIKIAADAYAERLLEASDALLQAT